MPDTQHVWIGTVEFYSSQWFNTNLNLIKQNKPIQSQHETHEK